MCVCALQSEHVELDVYLVIFCAGILLIVDICLLLVVQEYFLCT